MGEELIVMSKRRLLMMMKKKDKFCKFCGKDVTNYNFSDDVGMLDNDTNKSLSPLLLGAGWFKAPRRRPLRDQPLLSLCDCHNPLYLFITLWQIFICHPLPIETHFHCKEAQNRFVPSLAPPPQTPYLSVQLGVTRHTSNIIAVLAFFSHILIVYSMFFATLRLATWLRNKRFFFFFLSLWTNSFTFLLCTQCYFPLWGSSRGSETSAFFYFSSAFVPKVSPFPLKKNCYLINSIIAPIFSTKTSTNHFIIIISIFYASLAVAKQAKLSPLLTTYKHQKTKNSNIQTTRYTLSPSTITPQQ